MLYVPKVDVENNISYTGSNLAFQIKTLLNEMDLHNIWIIQEIWSIDLDEIKTNRITDIYKQNGYACINNSRINTSLTLKNTISLNQYRVAIIKFRLSSHNLEIKQGRHDGTPVDTILSLHCHIGSVPGSTLSYW